MTTVALAAGIAIGYGMSFPGFVDEPENNNAAAGNPDQREILYWVAPMDPNYRRDRPGKSPMGMDLVPYYADQQNTGGGVRVSIDASVVNNLGVETVAAEHTTLRPSVKTVGRLEYNDERLAHVHLRASGWIHRLAVRAEGERVTRGALLFDVYSPELVKAQAEYLQTLKSGRKELIEPTRDRLRALGITQTQINAIEDTGRVSQYVHVYSPRSGVVTKLNVADGKFVGPESDIMVIADPMALWLISDVFESHAGMIETGQAVEARTTFAGSGVINTEVEYIYPDLDPTTRTIRVRSVIENHDGHLKPGMFMTVSIAGASRPAATVIPSTALIRTGFSERVIVAEGNGNYRPVTVTSGIESEGRVEILRGLAEGARVVVSGQFLIDSESSFSGADARLTPSTQAPNDIAPDSGQHDGSHADHGDQAADHGGVHP